MPRIHKILIANRGEIACRVIRTAHALGYRSVAVYSAVDAAAPHVALADEAVAIGPAPAVESYLRIDRLLEAAAKSGADAVHPGYGFLSENPLFAGACADAGLTFIGPSAAAMRAMGDKALAKQRMIEAGVPTAPAYFGADQTAERLTREAARIGYPLLIKATAGGGGRGIRTISEPRELLPAIESARREAESAFGDGTLMLEKRIEHGRHVEVQVFADAHSNAVYLGDRDCSAQRRRQKLIEEAPAPGLSDALRQKMGENAVQAALSIGYTGAGTVEFMLDREHGYHFLEMNTRLQVEHPVTEAVTGLDLVAWQILIAEGGKLPLTQAEVQLHGHAIEARLYAEDPYAGFAPQTGRVTRFVVSEALSQPGVRIDSGIADGSDVTPYYDAMLAKLIVHGATREEATRKLIRALEDAPLFGLTTNARFLVELLRTRELERAELVTTTLDSWLEQGAALFQAPAIPAAAWALACALLLDGRGDGYRNSGHASFEVELACRSERRRLRVTQRSAALEVQVGETLVRVQHLRRSGERCTAELDGLRKRFFGFVQDGRVQLALEGLQLTLSEPSPLETRTAAQDPSRVLAPLAGRIARVALEAGAAVEEGTPVMVIEAMKMETRVLAAGSGRLRQLHCALGDQVSAGDLLASIELTKEST